MSWRASARSPPLLFRAQSKSWGPVDGVWFRHTHEEQPLVMSCEMARRLPDLVGVLKRHRVHGAEMLSVYRTTPVTSFPHHGSGLGLEPLLDGSRMALGATSLRGNAASRNLPRTSPAQPPRPPAACDRLRTLPHEAVFHRANAELQRRPPRPFSHRQPAQR